jgi:hypothetical protein
LGWVSHGGPTQTVPPVPVGTTTTAVPATVSVSPRPPSADGAPGPSREHGAVASVASPGAVIKQWEKRGYWARTQERRVQVALKDGRKLDIPVHDIRVQYVGGRTY